MKDGLYGAQLTHAKQFKASSCFENEKASMETAVTTEELEDIANNSLRDAVSFQAGKWQRVTYHECILMYSEI